MQLPLSNNLHLININIRDIIMPKVTVMQGKINIWQGNAGTGKSSVLELCLLPALYSLGVQNGNLNHDATYALLQDKFYSLEHSNVKVTTLSYVKSGVVQRSSKRSMAGALEVLQPLRKLYAQLPSSVLLGLTVQNYAWPSPSLGCEVPRFNGYNFAEVMRMSLEEVLQIFSNQVAIGKKLNAACKFGLGYVQLGQFIDTLSGGEVQRLNLTLHLQRANLAGAWFMLVHPSTGLHAPDIAILGELMRVMIAQGATFVLVENREEFLPYADYVVQFNGSDTLFAS